MSPQPVRILFLCTHNRCRSILAEAITRHLGSPLLESASAGSQPEGKVHPDTLQHLRARGLDTRGLHSKSWHEMAGFQPDYSIAVCQQAAGEACPAWMEHTPMIHWALPDPSKILDSAEQRQQAFQSVMDTVTRQVQQWRALLEQGSDEFHRYMQGQLARRSTQSLN
ncbi:arsenate reductase ArsC [Ketobacter sp.]|uniref:arsenate reductase ArsC n=1 Tax=Ketobacter sp. TaxID=2083498 RepID=UPI000F16EF07|nr:arsenate reductase ArsC [Ketobacter sp.]RLT93031.1 MAG: arsenate reductase ArsC [Ketobacter sp.]